MVKEIGNGTIKVSKIDNSAMKAHVGCKFAMLKYFVVFFTLLRQIIRSYFI